MIRVTTNGVLRTYKSGLMQSSNNLNTARNKVLTQRNFTSFAEDPAASVQAFQIRRSYAATASQLDNNKMVVKKFETAWSSMNTMVDDLVDKMGKVSTAMGNTGTAGASRQPLGEVLKAAAESMVQSLNSQYNGTFVFAGNDGDNVPFAWTDIVDTTTGEMTTKLTYRGIPVDCEKYKEVDPPTDPPTFTNDLTDDYKKLQEYAGDAAYIDLGMGLKEDENGELIKSSAFNQSISGVDIISFGLDEDGDPKNAISIMKQLSEIFGRCKADSGEFDTPEDEADALRLQGKLEKAQGELQRKFVETDSRTQFLKANQKRLEATAYNLNEQLLGIEQVDLADAITEFSWAQYCYNASLKVGNSILSQSLIDYMN